MKFLDRLLLSPEQFELKRAKQEFETCRAYRRGRLADFRINLVRSTLFSHPDTKFLVTTNCEDFMSYSKQRGKAVFGTFADHVFPRLDSILPDAPAAEFSRAVEQFRSKIQRHASKPFLDVPIEQEKEIGRTMSCHQLKTKGFGIRAEIENASIDSGSLYRDDECLADEGVWTCGNPERFSTALYDAVVYCRKPTKHGVSVIRLDVRSGPYGKESINSCRIFYDGLQRFDGDAGQAAFVRTFGELGDFLVAFSPEMASVTPEKENWEPSPAPVGTILLRPET